MRRAAVTAVALAVSLVPGLSGAGGHPFDSARGGGQVFLSGAEPTRAGNTIGFSAEATPGRLAGSVNYVETSLAGGGGSVPRWNGVPTCLRVDGNRAEIGGTIRPGGSTTEGFFALLVVDNGEPGGDLGVDTIRIQYPADEPDCTEDWDDADELTLARGNVVVHDAG